MIQLTERARDQINKVRFEQCRPEAGVRVAVLSGDCAGLNYFVGLEDFRGNDDFIVETQGNFLFIDSMSAPYLWGSEIDWVEVEDDAGFIVYNPNKGRSKGGCGKDGNGCMTKGDGNSCMNKKKKAGGGCESGGCSCGSGGGEELVQIEMN